MNPNFKIAREVKRILTASALLAGVSLPICAQDQSQEIETVVVTGSHIARTADEGALPVQVITQQEIERTGATTAEQFLQTVSAAVQGNSNTVAASASGANTGGVSGVSLRGLGSQRTLVLVNGRRLSGGGTITDSTSVDVNSIPVAALERVEVLKDGASAIYGSDAIAGVINFIIKDDYEGATLGLYGGGTDDGGGIKRANGAIGFGNLQDDRFNVMLAGGFQKEDSLFGRDRDFSSSGIHPRFLNDTASGNSFPANILVPDAGESAVPGASGTPGNPLAGTCAPSVTSPLRSPNVCAFDPSPLVSLFPDVERASGFGAAHFAITDAVQLYAEASYSHSKQRYVIQPVPISDQFNLPEGNPLFNLAPYNRGTALTGTPAPFAFATVVLSPSSPFYPTATVQQVTGGDTPDILVRYRAVANGNRDWTDTAEQPRGVLGIKGNVADWTFDAGYLYSETKLTEHLNGGVPLYSKLLPLLNSGQVNFFGANTPEIEAQLRATNFIGDAYSTKTSIQSFGATASRDLVSLPAGPLALALGAEWRQEKFSTDPSAEMQLGDISHYGGNQLPMDKSRDVTAFLAEMNVPIVENKLEADLAVRYDDYQNVGSKTTPKVSLRYQPVEQLLLRASFGKGFRAPSLTELFQPQTTGVTAAGISDPDRCPTTGNSNDCFTQFNTAIGGSPTLKPESSKNYTLGLVWEPSSNASAGFDAFKVKLTNPIIFGIDPEALLADPARFGNLITRGSPTADCPGCPGPVQQINQLNLNLGATNVEGLDADLRVRVPTSVGTFTWGLIGTYFKKYEIQTLDGSFLSVVGRVSPIVNGAGGVLPRWHHYMTVRWNQGPWEAMVTQNFQPSYEDVLGNAVDTEDPAQSVPRKVATYQTFDLQGSYTGVDRLKVSLGVKNAFDRDPPYTNAAGSNFFQAGYDPGYADPRGRFFYGTISYSFDMK